MVERPISVYMYYFSPILLAKSNIKMRKFSIFQMSSVTGGIMDQYGN